MLKEEERRNLEKDFEARSLDFKRKFEDFQRELKRTDAELTGEHRRGALRRRRASTAQQKGYTLVLEASSGAVLYGDKSIDITDEVIKLHNANPNQARGGEKRPPGTRGVAPRAPRS